MASLVAVRATRSPRRPKGCPVARCELWWHPLGRVGSCNVDGAVRQTAVQRRRGGPPRIRRRTGTKRLQRRAERTDESRLTPPVMERLQRKQVPLDAPLAVPYL